MIILKSRVDTTSYKEVTKQILNWAMTGESRYICVANVHMIMEAFDDTQFQAIMNGADLVTPDGMPLVWGMRLLGIYDQQRVYGPTLTLQVCEYAANAVIPIGLYGGTEESLSAFEIFLKQHYPGISIVCSVAPPFRQLTNAEDAEYTRMIVKSGARILFVGIGCPKQEKWMAAHKDIIPAVMIGVGAAFDFHSGRIRQSPALLQRLGLEWLFRFFMEPRRLWKRYLKHNPRFLVLFIIQIIQHTLHDKKLSK